MSIVVIHSDPLLATAISTLIEREGRFLVSATAASALEGYEIAESIDARVVLMADSLVESVPAEELRRFRTKTRKFAVLCSSESIPTRAATIADAVLNTHDGAEELFERLEMLGARRKGIYIAEDAAMYLGVRLSKREDAAAKFVAKGMSNRDIAEAMSVSEQSVKNYLRRLMRKLDCKNRVQLLLKLSGQ